MYFQPAGSCLFPVFHYKCIVVLFVASIDVDRAVHTEGGGGGQFAPGPMLKRAMSPTQT